MTKYIIKLLFISLAGLAFQCTWISAEEQTNSSKSPPVTGVWKGTWLEGMSSGAAMLTLSESEGWLALGSLPSFGSAAVPLQKLNVTAKRVTFNASGADGRAMRFDLLPSDGYQKMKGKAYYEGLHMELELRRAQ